jgi:hypothetical protein
MGAASRHHRHEFFDAAERDGCGIFTPVSASPRGSTRYSLTVNILSYSSLMTFELEIIEFNLWRVTDVNSLPVIIIIYFSQKVRILISNVQMSQLEKNILVERKKFNTRDIVPIKCLT